MCFNSVSLSLVGKHDLIVSERVFAVILDVVHVGGEEEADGKDVDAVVEALPGKSPISLMGVYFQACCFDINFAIESMTYGNHASIKILRQYETNLPNRNLP